MFFEIKHKDKKTNARTGVIKTDHGEIQTPCFMPVGTKATVKSLDPNELQALDAQIILGNTYHLHLQPGEDLVAKFGGLHKFMGWDGPILTDSGGFQVFSLGKQMEMKERKNLSPYKGEMAEGQRGSFEGEKQASNNSKLVSIDENGVDFRSHIDGSKHRFTPKSSIDIQHKIGADIIMAFDECTPDKADEKYTKEALERTHRWAIESIEAHKKNKKYHGYKQFLFGIVQGAGHKDMRIESAKFISEQNFDGIAIGGESIGYNMAATKKILDWVMPHIPEDKPHYTMGLGHSPLDLFEVVERGIDMFDCVSPTRIARNGTLYVRPYSLPLVGGDDTSVASARGGQLGRRKKYTINILNAKFKTDKKPIDKKCDCYTCQNFSAGYLHHLFKAEELLAYKLGTIHNLHFLTKLMEEMREAIEKNKFLNLKKKWM